MGRVFFNLNKKFFSRSSELRGIFSSFTVCYGCAGDLEGTMRPCARRLGADVRVGGEGSVSCSCTDGIGACCAVGVICGTGVRDEGERSRVYGICTEVVFGERQCVHRPSFGQRCSGCCSGLANHVWELREGSSGGPNIKVEHVREDLVWQSMRRQLSVVPRRVVGHCCLSGS